MGSTFISDQKLMFYPTSEFETHRLLALLGKVSIDYIQRDYIKKHILGEELTKQLSILILDHNISFDNALYDHWLNNGEYKLIKDNFKFELGCKGEYPITIFDLFAGKSEWLNSFRSIIPNLSECSNEFITVANEIEEYRYNSFKDNPNINDCYNLAFEQLQLPKNSCSLMLYNPPYGTIEGEDGKIRSTKYYLQMILDKQILNNSNSLNSKINYKTSYMVFVIRKDDFLNSLDIICKYFTVHNHCIYKVSPSEYAKYKQYVFIARLRNYPYDLNNVSDAMDFQNQYNKIKKIIESDPEFNLNMYNNYQMMQYACINYDLLKESMEFINNENNKISNISRDDSIWKWVKEISSVKNMGNEKIIMGKPPKKSELVNIMASGYINHLLQLDDEGTGGHIVVGGTKDMTREEVSTYKDDNNKNVTETKIIKFSQPYLNILCSQNGKLRIKELIEGKK